MSQHKRLPSLRLCGGFGLAALALLAPCPAGAVDVNMSGNNAAGFSSFNSSVNWANARVPGPTTNYFTQGFTMRTPTGSGAYTFQGASLTIGNGTAGSMVFKGSGVYTIGNCILNAGTLSNWDTAGDSIGKLNGAITVLATSTFDGNASGRHLDIRSTMSGAGGMTIIGSPGSTVRYSTNAKGYNGSTVINLGATLRIDLANAIPNGAGKGNVTLNGTLDIYGKNTSVNGLTGAGTNNNSSATAATMYIGYGDATSTFNGRITDTGGTLTLRKEGAGILTLTNPNNDFAGNVIINAGGVTITSAGAIGTGAKTIRIDNGTAGQCRLLLDGSGSDIALPATVTLQTSRASGTIYNEGGNNTIQGPILLNGGGGDTHLVVNAGTLTVSGSIYPIDTARNLQLSGAGDGTISGVISNTPTMKVLGVNKSGGAGTWTLLSDNLHTGRVTIAAGTLAVAAESRLSMAPTVADASHLTLAGGTLRATETFAIDDANRGITLHAGASSGISVDDTKTLTVAKVIAGTGNLSKSGTGALIMRADHTYTGWTTINAGTVQLGAGGAGANTGTLGAGAVTNHGTLVYARDNSLTVAAKVAGAGGIDVRGISYNDTLTLSGANTFTGPVAIYGGTLRTGASGSALGAAAGGVVVYTNAAQTASGSPTLQLDGVTVTDEPLELRSSSANMRTRLTTSGGANAWTGPITVKGDGSVQIAAGGTLSLPGSIAGTDTTTMMFRGGGVGTISGTLNVPHGTFFLTDNATWVIQSAGHNWSTTTVAYGTMRLGTDNAIPSSGPLRLGQGTDVAIVDLAGYNQQIGGLAVSGTAGAAQRIGNSSTTSDSTLTYSGGTSSYGGGIQDVVGSGTRKVNLTMAAGILTLSGTSTYTGPTTVNGGELRVSGSVASTVTVQSGAAYGGTGSCPTLNVAAGGTHRPGNGGIGTGAVSGSYTLDGTYECEISGVSATADRVNTTGTLTLNPGATLTIVDLDAINDPSYIIAQYGTLAGRFATTNGLPSGYKLVYDYGASHNQIAVVLAINEWDGGANPDLSWGADANWLSDTAPTVVTGEGIVFHNPGASVTAGEVTSRLDQDRTTGTLIVTNTAGSYHTLDLNGRALLVAGDLRLGSAALNTTLTLADTGTGGTLAITNGALRCGWEGGRSTLDVDATLTMNEPTAILDIARRDSETTLWTTGTLDCAQADGVSLRASQIRLATASAALNGGGRVRAIVTLPDAGASTLEAGVITLGDSPQQGNNDLPASEIHFGLANTVHADTFYVGRRKAHALADLDAGGTLTLSGFTGARANLRIGCNDAGTGTTVTGRLDVSAGTWNADLGEVSIGQHGSGGGGAGGLLTMGAGTVTANRLALATTGGTTPANTKGTFTLKGGSFTVVTNVTDGGGSSTISIESGMLTVTNGFKVDNLTVGLAGTNKGLLTAGGAVEIGTGIETLHIGYQTQSANVAAWGTQNLARASSVAINVNTLRVGYSTGDPGAAFGALLLATNGINTVTASALIEFGQSDGGGQTAQWTRFVAGGTTTLTAPTVYIGHRKSLVSASLAAGGSLTMGSAGTPIATLRIGYNDIDTGTAASGTLVGSNGTLVVYATDVVAGQQTRTSAGSAGSGTGRIVLDGAGDALTAAQLVLGQSSGSANATGVGELYVAGGTATVTNLVLADAQSGGRATGTVRLSGGTLNVPYLKRGDASGTRTVNFTWTGGTLTAGGTDLGATLTQSGGYLAPGGVGGVGATIVTGACATVAGVWQLDVDGAGATADKVTVTGALTLGGGSAVDFATLSALDDEAYVLAEYGTLAGTFHTVSGLPAGYVLDYQYGALDNQIALVRVPDPGAAARYRLPIGFAGYTQGDVLTNFPVLVVLRDGSNGFHYAAAAANGTDLRFADTDGVTALDYEIESWGSGSTPSYVWVRVPAFSAATTIHAYWGSGATQHALNHANGFVWLADFAAVWHLHTDETDATAHDYDGTNVATTNAVGVVASGQGFQGTSTGYIELPTSLVDSSRGTVDLWLRTSVNGGDAAHLFWGGPTTGNGFGDENELHLNLNAGEQVQFYARPVSISSPAAYADGQWHHVAATWDRTAARTVLYVDGRQVASSAAAINSFALSNRTRLGRPYDTLRYYQGLLDETRLSSLARSSNWVWATYMTVAQNATLGAYGRAERFLYPKADAFVQGGVNAAKNYGGSDVVMTKSQGANADVWRKTYLRFDLSAAPAGALVTNAALRLTINGGRNTANAYTFRLYGLADGDAGEGWLEGTGTGQAPGGGEICYNNAPANNLASGSGFLANAQLLETFHLGVGAYPDGSEVRIACGALADFLNRDGDDRVTLLLARTDGRDATAISWRSREGTPAAPLDQPTLTYSYLEAAPANPLFMLNADAVLQGNTAPGTVTNRGAATVLTNICTSGAVNRQLSVFRFSRVGSLDNKTFTFRVKLAGGTGLAANRPTTFHLWGLNTEAAEHWLEGSQNGAAAQGDEITWLNATVLADAYHLYPNAPAGDTPNNRLLATVTPLVAPTVDTVIEFEGTALDAFIHGSADAVYSFALTQSGAAADNTGWDVYSREHQGPTAQAATLTGHPPHPATLILTR